MSKKPVWQQKSTDLDTIYLQEEYSGDIKVSTHVKSIHTYRDLAFFEIFCDRKLSYVENRLRRKEYILKSTAEEKKELTLRYFNRTVRSGKDNVEYKVFSFFDSDMILYEMRSDKFYDKTRILPPSFNIYYKLTGVIYNSERIIKNRPYYFGYYDTVEIDDFNPVTFASTNYPSNKFISMQDYIVNNYAPI